MAAFVIRKSRIECRHILYPSKAVTLKPQDVLILLKIVALGRVPWSYNQLAYELGMSASEVHAGVRRAAQVGLLRVEEGWGYPDMTALVEFLVHGVRYAFAPEHGGMVQGRPTAYSAAPLKDRVGSADEPPTVWPDEDGPVRGLGFSPLYRSVPLAAQRDPELYELLVLVDALRVPHAARDIAVTELHRRLAPHNGAAGGRGAQQLKRGNHGKEGQLHRR